MDFRVKLYTPARNSMEYISPLNDTSFWIILDFFFFLLEDRLDVSWLANESISVKCIRVPARGVYYSTNFIPPPPCFGIIQLKPLAKKIPSHSFRFPSSFSQFFPLVEFIFSSPEKLKWKRNFIHLWSGAKLKSLLEIMNHPSLINSKFSIRLFGRSPAKILAWWWYPVKSVTDATSDVTVTLTKKLWIPEFGTYSPSSSPSKPSLAQNL